MKLLLLALAPVIFANAGTLFTDLGTGGSVYDPSNGSTVKGSGSGGSSITQARPFTVAGTGDDLVSQIDLGFVTQTGTPTFTASIWTDNSGLPGVELGTWNLSTSVTLGHCCGLSSQTGITGVTVTGGTEYFMVVGPRSLTDNSFNQWQWNTTGAVADQLGSLDGGATWINDGQGANLAFDVLGTSAAPEPHSLLLLGAGLAGMLTAFCRARQRQSSMHSIPAAGSTPNPASSQLQ
jgi:hypothetical protein